MFSPLFHRLSVSGTTKPNQEYNILLLGETGTGKSTTINALANYRRFGSFDEALAGPLVEVIGSRFTLLHPVTGDPVEIRSSDSECDRNERCLRDNATGRSSTRQPVTYRFVDGAGGLVFRLMDTPGVGDTDGIDHDHHNLDAILELLQCTSEVHAILIVVKYTGNRATATFKYCLTELLHRLHRSAVHNLVVCFTFSDPGLHSYGDAFQMVKELLAHELKEGSRLVLRPNGPGQNCFFLNNDVYRCLLASRAGFPYTARQITWYRQLWDHSVEQSRRMFDHIVTLKPHDLEWTVSLNNARKWIHQLAEPMVRLQETIDGNISLLTDRRAQLRCSTQNKIDLANELDIEIDDLERVDLTYPTTVCTADCCIEVIQYQSKQKVNYIRRCHEECQLCGVETNKIGHNKLKKCSAMTKGTCDECGCSWKVHMHLTCTFQKVKRSIVNINKQRIVQTMDEAIANINQAIDDMEQTQRELESEMNLIVDIGSKFGYILSEHSNTEYNKFLEPYLDLLIHEEKTKLRLVEKYPCHKLDRLEKMKATHIRNVAILSEAILKKSQKPVKLEDTFKCCKELFGLKHTGGRFATMVVQTQTKTTKDVISNDKIFYIGNEQNNKVKVEHSEQQQSSSGGSSEIGGQNAGNHRIPSSHRCANQTNDTPSQHCPSQDCQFRPINYYNYNIMYPHSSPQSTENQSPSADVPHSVSSSVNPPFPPNYFETNNLSAEQLQPELHRDRSFNPINPEKL